MISATRIQKNERVVYKRKREVKRREREERYQGEERRHGETREGVKMRGKRRECGR